MAEISVPCTCDVSCTRWQSQAIDSTTEHGNSRDHTSVSLLTLKKWNSCVNESWVVITFYTNYINFTFIKCKAKNYQGFF